MATARGWRARPLRVAACALASLVTLASLVATGARSGATAPASMPAQSSTGCSAAVAEPGRTVQMLHAGGEAGGYVREIPRSYSGRMPMPLVVDLHGYQETAALQAQLSQLGTLGAMDGFLTVTPQVAGPASVWHTGFGSKDVAFIGALLRAVDASLCVDLDRVYVAGYSNGAFLASVVACVYAGQVAAFAAVAGLVNPAGCRPARPVPVIAFHGTADPAVSYDGGLGPGAPKFTGSNGRPVSAAHVLGPNIPAPHGPSIPEVAAAWATRDGCGATPASHTAAAGVTLFAFPCPAGTDVELYRVRGGGRAWPGSPISKDLSFLGPTAMDISATSLMWDFFVTHPLVH